MSEPMPSGQWGLPRYALMAISMAGEEKMRRLLGHPFLRYVRCTWFVLPVVELRIIRCATPGAVHARAKLTIGKAFLSRELDARHRFAGHHKTALQQSYTDGLFRIAKELKQCPLLF